MIGTSDSVQLSILCVRTQKEDICPQIGVRHRTRGDFSLAVVSSGFLALQLNQPPALLGSCSRADLPTQQGPGPLWSFQQRRPGQPPFWFPVPKRLRPSGQQQHSFPPLHPLTNWPCHRPTPPAPRHRRRGLRAVGWHGRLSFPLPCGTCSECCGALASFRPRAVGRCVSETPAFLRRDFLGKG